MKLKSLIEAPQTSDWAKRRREVMSAKRKEKVDAAIQHILTLAREGKLGTPENPNRGAGERRNFWSAYFGQRKPAEFRGTVSYPHAKAGELYRKEMDAKK